MWLYCTSCFQEHVEGREVLRSDNSGRVMHLCNACIAHHISQGNLSPNQVREESLPPAPPKRRKNNA